MNWHRKCTLSLGHPFIPLICRKKSLQTATVCKMGHSPPILSYLFFHLRILCVDRQTNNALNVRVANA